MRLRSALVLVPALVLLAGCAPEPAPSPSPSTSPSSSPSASATPAPSPSPSPSAGAEFSKAELVTLCTEQTKALAPEATYYSDMATTEWLDQPSLWFVVIPKTLGDQDSVAVCAVGGSPQAPTFELAGESLPDGVAGLREELLASGGGE